MDMILEIAQVGAGVGLGLAAVVVVPMFVIIILAIAGGALGTGVLAILMALCWCGDRWDEFQRWRLG